MFLITLKQVGIMVGYIFLGYILCRKNFINKQASKFLSKLLVFVISPCYTANTISKGITLDKISDYIIFIIAGAGITIIVIFLSKIISGIFTKQSFERSIYKYIFTFSNMGYFGYPLINAVYGAETLANFMLFAMPINIAISSYGYYILTEGDEKEKKTGQYKKHQKGTAQENIFFPLDFFAFFYSFRFVTV